AEFEAALAPRRSEVEIAMGTLRGFAEQTDPLKLEALQRAYALLVDEPPYLSIGTELGPQIGTQKGPSCEVCWRGRSGAVLESPTVVAGLDDVAVVSEAVE
ncbi:hypothetical protein, partial [Sphingobium fuliginis]|uniref:hypothetical protein n=1 Tax=Sphingobium fuliginis (strain ATCC 27551) TaxID=336203 RepID=UPI00138E233A